MIHTTIGQDGASFAVNSGNPVDLATLQPPSHPWWHWALLIIPTATIGIILFVLLVHMVLFVGILFNATKQTERSRQHESVEGLGVENKQSVNSLLPNPTEADSFRLTLPSIPPMVKRAIVSPIKISRETKTYGSSSPQIPKANLPGKPPIPPENIGQPNLNNIPGIDRYQYNRPGPPQVGDNEKARKVFDKAYHHHKLKQLDEAIVGYREVLVLDPGFQQAHLNSAIAYRSKGEIKKALPSYELALAINPQSRESRYGFAQSLHRSKFYVDAAREYQKLLEVHKDHVPGRLALADLYSEKLKMPDRAKMHYRRILELNPQHSEADNIREWLSENP